MKSHKRLIVYSVLVLPFIAFGVFAATLDAPGRRAFFATFTSRVAEQFSGKSSGDDAEPLGSGPAADDAAGGGGQGGGRGGFDPSQMFERRDQDGDGKLSGDEIDERMQENLDQIDTDRDGAVTLEELQQSMVNRRRGAGGRRGRFDPAQIFESRDADNDGKLVGDEIGERMRENLSQIDTDQDGSVTLEEFQAGMQQMRRGGRNGFDRDPSEGRPERPQRPEFE